MKKILKQAFKDGIEISFGIAYWFVFGIFVLVGWVMEGMVLGIILTILFAGGYWLIIKIVRSLIRKSRKKQEKSYKNVG